MYAQTHSANKCTNLDHAAMVSEIAATLLILMERRWVAVKDGVMTWPIVVCIEQNLHEHKQIAPNTSKTF